MASSVTSLKRGVNEIRSSSPRDSKVKKSRQVLPSLMHPPPTSPNARAQRAQPWHGLLAGRRCKPEPQFLLELMCLRARLRELAVHAEAGAQCIRRFSRKDLPRPAPERAA